ncbi:MAG: hypothetical protein AAF441_15455 [Pseudomonadota bacterium]
MAETSSSIIGDLNFKSLISKGISGGLKSVTVSATEWIIGYGLDTLFGIETPKVKSAQEKQQLVDDLNQISKEMTYVVKTVTQIKSELDTLSATLNTDLKITLTAVGSVVPEAAMNEVDFQWAKLSQIISDQLDGSSSKNPPNLGQFAEDVLSNTGSAKSAYSIYNGLLYMGDATNTGLINDWANQIISALSAARSSVDDATFETYVVNGYMNMAQSFTQTFQYLIKAYALTLNAEIYQARGTGTAQTTLSDTIFPHIANLSENFRQATHRLVLSNYGQNDGSAFLPFLSQDTVQQILSNAYLIAALLEADEPESPVLTAVVYTRPSVLAANNNGGPPLTPASGYQASNGKVIDPSQTYGGTWYKVFDFSDSEYTQAYSYDDSDIAVVEYKWPLSSEAAAGTPVGTGMFAAALPEYYDAATLQQTTADADNTLLFAFACDFQALLDNPFCNDSASGWSVAGPDIVYAKSSADTQGTLTTNVYSTANGLPKKAYIFATENTHNFGGDDADWNYTVTRSFTASSGTNTPYLQLSGQQQYWTSSTTQGEDLNAPHVGSGYSVTFNGDKLSKGSAEIEHTTVSVGSGEQSPEAFSSFTNQALVDGTNSLVLTATVSPQHSDSFSHSDQDLNMSADVELSQAILGWEQPGPSSGT